MALKYQTKAIEKCDAAERGTGTGKEIWFESVD